MKKIKHCFSHHLKWRVKSFCIEFDDEEGDILIQFFKTSPCPDWNKDRHYYCANQVATIQYCKLDKMVAFYV